MTKVTIQLTREQTDAMLDALNYHVELKTHVRNEALNRARIAHPADANQLNDELREEQAALDELVAIREAVYKAKE